MIHKTNIMDSLATPLDDMKIMNPVCLDLFKKQVRDFIAAIVQGTSVDDEAKIYDMLLAYKLRSQDIISNYTILVKKS